MPSTSAVTVAVPAFFAFTFPAFVTVAIALFEDFQVALPFPPVTFSVALAPTCIDNDLQSMEGFGEDCVCMDPAPSCAASAGAAVARQHASANDRAAAVAAIAVSMRFSRVARAFMLHPFF